MIRARAGAYDRFMFHFQDGERQGTIQNVPGSQRMGSGTVRVTRREIQRTVLGKVMCFRVEPEVFGINRLIARPIATMTVEAQQAHERREKISRDD